MARSSSNVDVMLRLRGARKFAKEVDRAGKDLEGMGLKGAGAMAKFANQSDRLKNFGSSWTKKFTLPIVAGAGLAVKAASDWESSFANVRKTVDTNEAGFARLEKGLRNMALEIPVSANELAELAGTAGQLGIAEKNVLGFTRVMADMGVATDLVGESGAMTMARFAQNMGMPQTQFDRLGSTVVALGNSLPGTESEIMNFASRISAASKRIGLAEHETLSWAGALSGLDIAAEAGGTAMSTVFSKMNSSVISGGEGLKQFADVAGLSGKAFSKLFKKDASSAALQFVKGLDRIHKGGGDMVGTLKDMGLGGLRITDTLGRAAANTDLLTKALDLGGTAWSENKALADEAKQRYKTFEGQMQILKNVFKEIGIVFAENLLPHLSSFVQWIGPKVTGVVDFFKGLPKPIQIVSGSLVGLLAAIGPVAWGAGLIAGAVGKWLIVGSKIIPIIKGLAWVTKIWSAALLTNPVVLIAVGLVALGAGLVLAYKKVGWFRDAVDAAFAWVKGAAGWVGEAFTNVKNWVSDAVSDMVNFIKRHWSKIVMLFGGPIGQAVVLVIKNFDKIKSAASSVKDWVTNAFGNVVGFIKGLPGKIANAARGMFDGIKDALRGVLNWIIDKWNSTVGKLSFEAPGWVPGIGGKGFSMPTLPELGTGGFVHPGGAAIVGETGTPELLEVSARGAKVTPFKAGTGSVDLGEALQGLFKAAATEITINVNSILDGEKVSQSVARHVSNAAARM